MLTVTDLGYRYPTAPRDALTGVGERRAQGAPQPFRPFHPRRRHRQQSDHLGQRSFLDSDCLFNGDPSRHEEIGWSIQPSGR